MILSNADETTARLNTSRVHLPILVVREGLVVLSSEQQRFVVLVSIGEVARRSNVELVLGDG